MARHAVAGHRAGRGVAWLVLLLVIGLLSALGAGALAGDPRAMLARAPVIGEQCPSGQLPTTSISVTVAPDVTQIVEQLIAPLRTRELTDGNCLTVDLNTQEPAETVAGAEVLPDDRAPQLWIPDSSLWAGRLERWRPQPLGNFASSPVVLATSPAAVQDLGWADEPPTWAQAMGGTRPVAARDIAQDAASLSAVIALWQTLGKNEAAEQGMAAAVLAALRAGAPTRQEALVEATTGRADAALIPVPEQVVTLANAAGPARLAAVYPQGGSPSLDYPILRLDSPTMTPQRREAVRAVVAALTSPAARDVIRKGGLRDASGAGPPSSPDTVQALTSPAPAEVTEVVRRVVSLSAPSRILVTIDMSPSMAATSGYQGKTRAEFAAIAAHGAGLLMPDIALVGLWGFSRELTPGVDRVELQPVRELGTPVGKATHRDAVDQGMFAIPRRLGGNGTTLYATAIAGMKRMTAEYEPRAGNAVVLFTDGANDDDGGPSLEATVAELKRLYDPAKPVRLICIGIGPGADMTALTRLADAAGGRAYPAQDPKVLPRVLFEAMSRRDG